MSQQYTLFLALLLNYTLCEQNKTRKVLKLKLSIPYKATLQTDNASAQIHNVPCTFEMYIHLYMECVHTS